MKYLDISTSYESETSFWNEHSKKTTVYHIYEHFEFSYNQLKIAMLELLKESIL